MASFKTAWLQKAIILDADVVGDTKVGDYVTLTAANGATPAYIKKSKIANATHIVALSDMTLEYGHIPVEHRDYRPSTKVAKTVDNNPSGATTTYKKVGLYSITGIYAGDIIPDADGNDCLAAE